MTEIARMMKGSKGKVSTEHFTCVMETFGHYWVASDWWFNNRGVRIKWESLRVIDCHGNEELAGASQPIMPMHARDHHYHVWYILGLCPNYLRKWYSWFEKQYSLYAQVFSVKWQRTNLPAENVAWSLSKFKQYIQCNNYADFIHAFMKLIS